MREKMGLAREYETPMQLRIAAEVERLTLDLAHTEW
jgi:hypothetical protein